MKTIKKMIVMIMLIAMLVPAGVWAQDYRDSYAQQTLSQEELAQMLADAGLPLPSGVLTVDDMVKELKACLSKSST